MQWFRVWSIGIIALLAWAVGGAAEAAQPGDTDTIANLKAVEFEVRSGGTTVGSHPDWRFEPGSYIETRLAVPNEARLSFAVRGFTTGLAHRATGRLRVTLSIDGQTAGYAAFGPEGAYARTIDAGVVVAGFHTVRLAADAGTDAGNAHARLMLRDIVVSAAAQAVPPRPPGAGLFAQQSISILSGEFGQQFWGLDGGVCRGPGCLAIDFVKSVGGNDVTLTTSCSITLPGTVSCAPQIDGGATELAARRAVRYARGRGLGVTLKASVQVNGQVPGGVAALTPSATFFDGVEANLLAHARLAAQEGAWLLTIGTEFGGRLTGANWDGCSRWRGIIAKIRAIAPQLKLSYAPTLAGHWNDSQGNEATRVCFWDKLDFIGVNVYPHLNAASDPITADVVYRAMFDNGMRVGQGPFDWVGPGDEIDPGLAMANYVARYGSAYSAKFYADFVIDGINAWRRTRVHGAQPLQAIITEVGAPSYHLAGRPSAGVTQYWGVHFVDGRNGYQPRWAEQAAGWEGYLRAFRNDPRIHGVMMWGLLPFHHRWDQQDPMTPGNAWNALWYYDYDFNGKPAEQSVCRMFKSHAPDPCYVPPVRPPWL